MPRIDFEADPRRGPDRETTPAPKRYWRGEERAMRRANFFPEFIVLKQNDGIMPQIKS
jgi:hypothetical protein